MDTDFRDDGSCRYHKRGCNDPEAWNFDQNATKHDGSCRYHQYGCRDSTALNYNQRAVRDCHEIVVPGGLHHSLAVVEINGTEMPYNLCRDASLAIQRTCCAQRGVDGSPDEMGNTSLCVFPPPPPPPWWERLDYTYFVWGSVALGILLLIRWCRSIFKQTASFVAPVVEHTEFDQLGGRYMPCARCSSNLPLQDSRLAVRIFVRPDGSEEPLCEPCFHQKERIQSLAGKLLDADRISTTVTAWAATSAKKKRGPDREDNEDGGKEEEKNKGKEGKDKRKERKQASNAKASRKYQADASGELQ